MSWDVLLTRLPYSVRSVQELPDDFQAPPLGPRDQVKSALRAAEPSIDLSDPTWGELVGRGWSIDLDLGGDDPVEAIMLQISGTGDDVLDPVFRMAAELGCRVLDCSAGDIITEQDSGSWRSLHGFRRAVDPPR